MNHVKNPPNLNRWSVIAVLNMALLGGSDVVASSPKSVSQEMAKGVIDLPDKKVAIMKFLYPNSGVSSGFAIVAKQLTTIMVAQGN